MKNKVLITGAGGFIGSHLTEACVQRGYQVKAYVHYNSRNDWGWLEISTHKKDLEVISGDIRDYDSVHYAMEDCQTVFHLAALIGIPYSYISPVAYIKTNVEGTYNLLESARELEVENILTTSTSETYGTAQYIPMDEDHTLLGQSPYSASKIGADQLAISYHKSFDLPVKLVRPFNTYGPRQSARAVILTIALQLLSGESLLRLGNIHPTRDFTYVKDTVTGFLKVAESEKLVGEVTNVGTNTEISIRDIAELIAKIIGTRVTFALDETRIRPENSEVNKLCCDNTKILTYTDWKPQYDIEKGLIETIDWFRANTTRYKSLIYNV